MSKLLLIHSKGVRTHCSAHAKIHRSTFGGWLLAGLSCLDCGSDGGTGVSSATDHHPLCCIQVTGIRCVKSVERTVEGGLKICKIIHTTTGTWTETLIKCCSTPSDQSCWVAAPLRLSGVVTKRNLQCNDWKLLHKIECMWTTVDIWVWIIWSHICSYYQWL